MEDIRQTKEGFIKSMILFVVLLSICFAPFFAFSQVASAPLYAETSIQSLNDFNTNLTAKEASKYTVRFDMQTVNREVKLTFSTEFRSVAYAIEGRMATDESYRTVMYCNDALCMDTRNSVSFTINANEQVYDYYRVRTTILNGDFVYSDERKMIIAPAKDIELINTAVVEKLHLKWNKMGDYTYSITSVRGEIICSAEAVSAEGVLDMSNMETGFYMISFTSSNGDVYHYKFFKTAKL